jgi:hypothetical protein
MNKNEWFRARMGNDFKEPTEDKNSNDWNIVRHKDRKHNFQPTPGAYVPPSMRNRPNIQTQNQNTSWDLRRKLETETKQNEEKRLAPTAEDFPTLGEETITPKPNLAWGKGAAPTPKVEKDELPKGWYNLSRGNYPKGPVAPTFKYGPPPFRSGFPDDPDAEWRQKYRDMYPDDVSEPDDANDVDLEANYPNSEDEEEDKSNPTEIKYSGRRARKNRIQDEDEQW